MPPPKHILSVSSYRHPADEPMLKSRWTDTGVRPPTKNAATVAAMSAPRWTSDAAAAAAAESVTGHHHRSLLERRDGRPVRRLSRDDGRGTGHGQGCCTDTSAQGPGKSLRQSLRTLSPFVQWYPPSVPARLANALFHTLGNPTASRSRWPVHWVGPS